jgi:hypothetical protein
MTVSKQLSRLLSIALLAGVLGVLGIGVVKWLPIPDIPGIVSPAHAVVGRPLTPVSVAGVARRSARRCDAGVTC